MDAEMDRLVEELRAAVRRDQWWTESPGSTSKEDMDYDETLVPRIDRLIEELQMPTPPRFTVRTTVNRHVRNVAPVHDPIHRTTVDIGWMDLLRGLLRRHLVVEVAVNADPVMMGAVMRAIQDAPESIIPAMARIDAQSTHG